MAAIQLDYRGPAPTNAQGILNCYVLQPTDSAPELVGNVPRYRETWKGPYLYAKELAKETGIPLTTLHTRMGTGLELIRSYDVPTCPTIDGQQLYWKVTSIKIQELEAGDHALVTIDCEGANDLYDVQTLLSDQKQDVWSLSYQTVTYSPYAFCSNQEPKTSPQSWSPGYDTAQHPTPDWSDYAHRTNIAQAFQYPNCFPVDKTTGKSNFLVFETVPPDANTLTPVREYLNPAESAIAKKIYLDKNVIYHTPIVTHQTVERTTASKYQNTLGYNLDHLEELPSDCPYKFEDEKWEWLKIADDCTQQKNKVESGWESTFTRRQVWQGFPKDSCDKNFYGNGTFTHTESGILEGRWPLQGL